MTCLRKDLLAYRAWRQSLVMMTNAAFESSDGFDMDSSDDELVEVKNQDHCRASSARERRSAGSAQFLCKPVCWSALRRLLGVGDSTLQKMRRGEQVYGGRPKRPKHPVFGFSMDDATSRKWHGVVTFLWAYISQLR